MRTAIARIREAENPDEDDAGRTMVLMLSGAADDE
jgi:hypothetical protein